MAASETAWNSSELLSACCGATVKVWNPIQADRFGEVKLNEGTPVYTLDWSTNNKVLAVAGDKPQVSMYGNGQLIGQVPAIISPNLDGVTCMRFGSDSKRMILGCKNRFLHILDLRNQVRRQAFLAAPACVKTHRACAHIPASCSFWHERCHSIARATIIGDTAALRLLPWPAYC
jgi:WD40 repeat protein